MSGTYFPDADLVLFVADNYGVEMAEHVDAVLELDPENETGFANSVRRSLTREIHRHLVRPKPEKPQISMHAALIIAAAEKQAQEAKK